MNTMCVFHVYDFSKLDFYNTMDDSRYIVTMLFMQRQPGTILIANN